MFKEIFPPIETALDMETEELAPFVLKHLKQVGKINRYNYTLRGHGELREYADEHLEEFQKRLMEAFVWLAMEKAKQRLLTLYGVGPETARILLVEALHYYDIFNHVAPWQQKIYSRLLFNKKLVTADKIIKYVNNKWGEWANLAASYIWEDIFWQRKQGKKIDWLEKEIRL